MRKNITKIIFIIILCLITINMLQVTSNANWADDAKSFTEGKIESETKIITIKQSQVQKVSNIISGVLLGISVIVAVVTTAILGMNFIVESAEGKAKVKEALVPLIIGMIISFGAFAIWKFAIKVIFNIN